MAVQKTVLFLPINSPGHTNSSLHIADQMRQVFGYRTVFVFLGPSSIENSIKDHGHELIVLDEVEPHQDYEISDDEDPLASVDEELMKSKGKTKKTFLGFHKFPQIFSRMQQILPLDPVEALNTRINAWRDILFHELIVNNEILATAIESINPDLIVMDHLVAPVCVVKEEHRRPWVRIHSANPLMLLKSKLPDGVKPLPLVGFQLLNKQERTRLRNEEPQNWQAMVNTWREAGHSFTKSIEYAHAPLKELFEKHQCADRIQAGQIFIESPHLNIYMFPEALDYDQDDDLFEYSARYWRCDSLIRRPIGHTDTVELKFWSEKLAEAMKDKEAMIYFSLGSIASGDTKRLKKYIEMLEDDDKRLYVVSKGPNGHKFKLNANNMIGDNYIPQTFFFQYANLAIIHGGNNSITECMYYGLPMIVLPLFTDQLDNGQRVEDLGFGRRLNVHTCTKEQLRQAIDDLLSNKPMIEKMRQIGQRMQLRDGVGKVSLVLKKLAEDKHLEQDFIDKCRDKSLAEVNELLQN